MELLLVCTYKCVHLNISRFEENQAGWYRTKLFGIPYWPEEPLLRKTLRKFKWMFFILMAPELGVPIALDEIFEGRTGSYICELHPEEGKSIDERLTLTRGFYANIGGFAGVLAPASRPSGTEEILPGASAGEEHNFTKQYEMDLVENGQYTLSERCKALRSLPW